MMNTNLVFSQANQLCTTYTIIYHDILAMNNLPIATVYDLEKAFDRVGQTLLLSKLKNSGLNGPILATLNLFYRIGKSVCKSMIISKCHLSLLMVYIGGLYSHHFCLYSI